MRHFLVLIILLLSAVEGLSQDLITGLRKSPYTYIFSLSNAEARQAYQDQLQTFHPHYADVLVDSFLTGRYYAKSLPVGNYLYVHAQAEELVLALESVQNVAIRLIPDPHKFVAAVYDTAGNLRTDARMLIDGKSMHFQGATRTYQRKFRLKYQLLEVECAGVSNFFYLEQYDDGYRLSLPKRILNRIIYFKPVRMLWRPVQDVVNSIRWGNLQGWLNIFNPDQQKLFRGYLTFNQPLYRTGDTVYFKGFVLKKHRPFRKPLQLTLSGETSKGYKTYKLPTVKPYRPGAYEGYFVLHDSLALLLDAHATLSFVHKRKTLGGQFKLEDYELKGNSFSLRASRQKHVQGAPPTIILRGTDVNGLSLLGGEVTLVALSRKVENLPRETQLLVSDTLWQHRLILEPIGDTQFQLPDSLFARADMQYALNATLKTAQQEYLKQSLTLEYRRDALVDFVLEDDSLFINYLKAGKSDTLHTDMDVLLYDQDGEELEQEISLPARLKLDPRWHELTVWVGQDYVTLALADKSALVTHAIARTPDSLLISISNKRQIPFWYSVYTGAKKKRKIAAGYSAGEAVLWEAKAARGNTYFLKLNYLWAGQMQEVREDIPLLKKLLNIAVEVPEQVRPGEKVAIGVHVTNQQGKGVAGVDLTAFAYNKKMPATLHPQVPYLGKEYWKPMYSRELRQDDMDVAEKKALDWQAWRQRLGLDSIAFYQFSFPQQDLYKYTLPLENFDTQFAPYVLQNGVPQQVHIIYLNGIPIYYSEVETHRAYSFMVSPYKTFTLSLRTTTHLITLDSVRFARGQKTILSLSPSIQHPKVKVEEKLAQLSERELDHLNRYLVVVNHTYNRNYAYLEQDDQVQMINTPNHSNQTKAVLAGPFNPNSIQYELIDHFKTSFPLETGYEYRLQPNLVFAKSTTPEWEGKLDKKRMPLHLNDVAIKRAKVHQLWQQYLKDQNRQEIKYEYPKSTSAGNGRLVLAKKWVHTAAQQVQPSLKVAVVLSQTDTSFVRVYPINKRLQGLNHMLHELPPGNYRLLGLLHNDTYLEVDTATIAANTTTYLNLNVLEPKANDAVIEQIKKVIDMPRSYKAPLEKQAKQELGYINQVSRMQTRSSGSQQVSGRVVDEGSGEVLPGVTIRIKGTNMGAVTDMNGEYVIYINPGDVLVFGFIGYSNVEQEVGGRSSLNVSLVEDVQHLSEVVVVGYGSQQKRSMLSSVSVLQGKAAGVTISSSSIRIRGYTSISGNAKPLIIVDGVPYEGDVNALDAAQFASMQMLNGEEATAIWGSRGAQGVILITTGNKQSANEKENVLLQGVASQQNTMRTNFRDWAYWQPRLNTDKQGRAQFVASFPDNITAWEAQVLAVGKKRYTGQTMQTIKAVKPLWAAIAMPRFLLTGDSALVMGQVNNYTPDTLDVSTRFTLGKAPQPLRHASLASTLVDSVWASTATTDSLSITYEVRGQEAFLDGERRTLPVYRRGVREAKGEFMILRPDSSRSLSLSGSTQSWKLQGYATTHGPLLNELRHVIDYGYYCNEQAASKLYALLLYNGLRQEQDKKPQRQQLAQKLILKLVEDQGKDGLWGWWPGNAGELWITRHVVGALQLAREQGYAEPFDAAKLQESLLWKLKASNYPYEQLGMLEVFAKLQTESVPYADYIPALEKTLVKDEIARLRLLRLRSATGLSFTAEQVLALKHETLLGTYYWGSDHSWNPATTSQVATAWAYDLLMQAGEKAAADKAELYLWANRPVGYWRNTYESSQALLQLLPRALLHEKQVPALRLEAAGEQQQISKFPMDKPLELPAAKLDLTNTGNTPIYLSAYSENWVEAPAAAGEDLMVSTRFSNDKTYLKTGEAVTQITEVTVKKEAEYVMIEIPIPAGCTYEDKQRHWSEIHREYFRDRVVIFCRKLPEGKHAYILKLIPRFKGTYTLNPAQASLMYFPSIFGRSGIKTVEIK